MDSSYIKSANEAQQLPQFDQPEVALVGRSNCGKSSLLNALVARRNLARAGRTPGRTQMINFFKWINAEQEIILADLPGYGYSGTGRKTRESWETLVKAYVERQSVCLYLFLIDCRRRLDDDDIQLATFLAQRGKLALVLTKADKLSRSQAAKLQNEAMPTSQGQSLKIVGKYLVSALKGKGIDKLRSAIFEATADE